MNNLVFEDQYVLVSPSAAPQDENKLKEELISIMTKSDIAFKEHVDAALMTQQSHLTGLTNVVVQYPHSRGQFLVRDLTCDLPSGDEFEEIVEYTRQLLGASPAASMLKHYTRCSKYANIDRCLRDMENKPYTAVFCCERRHHPELEFEDFQQRTRMSLHLIEYGVYVHFMPLPNAEEEEEEAGFTVKQVNNGADVIRDIAEYERTRPKLMMAAEEEAWRRDKKDRLAVESKRLAKEISRLEKIEISRGMQELDEELSEINSPPKEKEAREDLSYLRPTAMPVVRGPATDEIDVKELEEGLKYMQEHAKAREEEPKPIYRLARTSD